MNPVLRFLKKNYTHPLADHLDIDSAQAVDVHRRIIRENPLLMSYYTSVYRAFGQNEAAVKEMPYPSLEIGSGGGFIKEFLPDVITSDVVAGPGIDRVEDACRLNFADRSLKAVFANGVLHHISDPARCLSEIERVLVPGGLFVANEPSSSLFGYFMNRNFHHEPTDKSVREWGFGAGDLKGRLSAANMALPYIIFRRDAALFHKRFPRLKIAVIRNHDFLRYILSGGLSYRPLVPRFLFGVVNAAEVLFRPLMFLVGQGMLVTVRKINNQ